MHFLNVLAKGRFNCPGCQNKMAFDQPMPDTFELEFTCSRCSITMKLSYDIRIPEFKKK